MSEVSAQHKGGMANLQRKENTCSNACEGLHSTVQLALIIIASLGLAGVINPAVMGGTLVGLSVASLITGVAKYLAQGESGLALCTALLEIALIVISALAMHGIVSPTVAGWCIIGPTIVRIAVMCCVGSCACCVVSHHIASHGIEGV